MPLDKQKTQLAIIGAGPGGYAAAFRAADLGMQVTLIDKEANPGGVCLYRGCIPSKALLHVAKVITEAEEIKECGVEYGKPKIDVKKLFSWKDNIVQKLTGGLGQLVKQRKINFIQGQAQFVDSQNIQVDQIDGNQVQIKFDHAIVATGSHPVILSNLPDDSSHIIYSEEALHLGEVPQSMLVVGGGYIGLELGSVYAALGTKVSVVEMMPTILPGVDGDLVTPLKKKLDQVFEAIYLKAKVEGVNIEEDGVKVKIIGDGGEKELFFEKVLVSVGRKPKTSGVGLEKTHVKLDEAGFIKVDGQRRTTDPTIYAIGDVTGQPMLAHKASHEAFVAVEAINGKNVSFEPQAIPGVVFTDPEIAWCGLTEAEAKAQNKKVEVARFPWAASGRAATLGRSDGVTKLIIDPESEQILGVGLCGPGAGELIAEGALAIEMGATASDLKLTIHPHPTLSETLMEAAEVYFGQATHLYRPRRH